MRGLALFLLMTRKNFIIIRRSIIWTILELIVPILIGIPLSYFMFLGSTSDKPNRYPVDYTNPVVTLYPTLNMNVDFAYSHEDSVDVKKLERLLNKLCQKDMFCNRRYYETPSKLFDDFINKGNNEYTFRHGYIFKEIDFTNRILRYDTYFMRWSSVLSKEWYGTPFKDWNDVYQTGLGRIDYTDMFFQHACYSTFISISGLPELPPIAAQSLLFTFLDQRNYMSVLPYFSYILAGLILPSMIHTAREIAAEKESGMKNFLAVMGISPMIFNCSHIFIGWLKGCIVLTLCLFGALIRFPQHPSPINPLFLLLPVYLYVLAATVCAAAVASLFKTSNSAIKVVSVVHPVLLILSAISQVQPSIYNPWVAFASSLNYNTALYCVFNIIYSYLLRNRTLSFAEFFEQSEYIFNIGPAMLTLILDSFWMSLVILCAEYYYASTDFSLWTTIKRMFKSRSVAPVAVAQAIKGLENSHETTYLQEQQADIIVEHLSKVWGSTGEFAVQDMNLRALRGEITVLLGHNGAGKSTTFSVISGLTPPSSGHVKIDENNIGFCPQANALFEKLTCMEHLWFFHSVKQATNSWQDEGIELLTALQMYEKRNTMSSKLSGGMKRKLCLSMALIGNSRVILLDEPTAGMDTGARQDVQRMLDSQKKERTILLTTHYMDEAEALGDRISIMVRGRDVAFGTPQFLKNRFGTGYALTIVLSENSSSQSHAEEIYQIICGYVEDAKFNRFHGKQLEITLPANREKMFPDLFAHLETFQRKFGISSFGLSINNLEQVFLRVGEMAEPPEEHHNDLHSELFDPALEEKNQSVHFLQDVRVLLQKRIIYSIRNWPQWIFQLFVPLFVAYVFGFAINWDNLGYETGNVASYMQKLDLNHLGKMKFYFNGDNNVSGLSVYGKMLSEFEAVKDFQTFKIDVQNATAYLAQQPMTLPPPGGIIDFSWNKTYPKLMPNTFTYWVLYGYTQCLANAYLSENGGGTIETSIGSINPSRKSNSDLHMIVRGVEDYIVPLLTVLIFALLMSPFTIFHVVERVSKFLHQQNLSAVPIFTFYFSSVLYDFVTFLILTGLLVIPFQCAGWTNGQLPRMLLVFGLFFCAVLPLMYLLASFFTAHSKANTFVMIYQTFGAYGSLIVIEIIPTFVEWDAEPVARLLQILFPSFGLYRGLMFSRILGEKVSSDLDDPDYINAESRYNITLILFVISGFIFTICAYLLRSGKIRYMIARSKQRPMDINDDIDVQNERSNVQTNTGKFCLELNDLTKFYGKFLAVNRLTFGLTEAECFGLLGVNGAGKTSTFGILTGEQFASSGKACLNGEEIKGVKTMGYCPQFDAYLLELTGREVLYILATLYRYKHPRKKTESILKAVLMTEHANKQLKHCSGGQKRKISVGISLLANSSLIILDEPTAGIDPKARREIWSLIGVVRKFKKSTVLLCSHSMDECEALCTRVGILVRGHLRAVGTTQHLKSRFGNSYQLTLIFAHDVIMNEGEIQNIHTEVATTFNGAIKRNNGTQSYVMQYTIPRKQDEPWSKLWQKCVTLAERTNAKNYSIAQDTLAQTFLTLSREGQMDAELA